MLASNEMFSKAEMVRPGFINLDLNPDFLGKLLNELEQDPDCGVEKAEHPLSIVVDYGGPNVAKPLHVGHLRPAIIGEAVKRIARFMGHNVIGDPHLGDWGLQIGLIIVELKRRQPTCPILTPTSPTATRRNPPSPSPTWKRSTPSPPRSPRRTPLIRKKPVRPPTNSSRVVPAIAPCGSTS